MGSVWWPPPSPDFLSKISIKVVITPRLRPNVPSENSIVIGTVTRLNSQQATISIGVVDGIPLPHGEDYTGVIRSQDIRATEKDKIKIGDCFRGGDIVKGQVVSSFTMVCSAGERY
jgi:exosome complex component CSL4